jgi:glucan phosphoethanolaminetransferase (alkaline phosphatase superfamily)|tara:strand:- start:263 stop:586 length:324 start_codon:yes stop_codon:yes gene_type:complete
MAQDEERNITEELIQARVEIERLKSKSSTTLSGTEFLTLLFVLPIILCFVILGTIIIWKTTSNPSEVAPHLDIILVAFAMFSGPVTAFVATMAQRLVADGKKPPAED